LLLDGDNRMIILLFVLTQYQRVTDKQTDRWTDRWTDRQIYHLCLCRAL